MRVISELRTTGVGMEGGRATSTRGRQRTCILLFQKNQADSSSNMNLKEALKPHQIKVQKGFMLQFLNEEGVIETVRIASSTLTKFNQKDEREGLGKGLYFDVFDEDTRTRFTLNLGESGDTNGIWVAYKATAVHPPSLKQILKECKNDGDPASSLSKILVSSEEMDGTDPAETDSMEISRLIKDKDCQFIVDMRKVKAVRAGSELLMGKLKAILDGFRENETQQSLHKKKQQYLKEKHGLISQFEALIREMEEAAASSSFTEEIDKNAIRRVHSTLTEEKKKLLKQTTEIEGLEVSLFEMSSGNPIREGALTSNKSISPIPNEPGPSDEVNFAPQLESTALDLAQYVDRIEVPPRTPQKHHDPEITQNNPTEHVNPDVAVIGTLETELQEQTNRRISAEERYLLSEQENFKTGQELAAVKHQLEILKVTLSGQKGLETIPEEDEVFDLRKLVEDLTAEKRRLEENVSELKRQICRLTVNLQSQQDTLDESQRRLLSEMGQLDHFRSVMEATEEDLQNKVSGLTTQLRETLEQLARKDEMIREHEKRRTEAKEETRGDKERIEKLQREIQIRAQTEVQMTKRLNEERERSSHLTAKVDYERAKHERLKAGASTSSQVKEKMMLEEQLRIAQSQVQHLETRLTEQDKKNAELRERVAQSGSRPPNEPLEARIRENGVMIESLKAACENWCTRHNEKEAELQKALQESIVLRNTIEELQKDHEKKKAQWNKDLNVQEGFQNGWKLKHKEVTEDLTKAKEDLNLWKDKHHQMGESLQQQYNETRALEEQLTTAKDSQTRNMAEISSLKDKLQHKTAELDDCRKQRIDDQNRVKAEIEDSCRRRVAGLQDSLEEANSKEMRLANSLKTKELEIVDLNAEIRNLQENAETKKDVRQSLHYLNLQRDNDRLKKRLEDFQQQVQDLKQELNLRKNDEDRGCDSGRPDGKSHSKEKNKRNEKEKRKDTDGQRPEEGPTGRNQANSQRPDNHGQSSHKERPRSTCGIRRGDDPNDPDPSSSESSDSEETDAGEDSLRERSKARRTTTRAHPTKVGQEIALLQAELRNTMESIYEDYVLNQEDIAALSSDVLKTHMKNATEYKTYKKEIAAIKIKLERLKIRNENALSQTDIRLINAALNSCKTMKEEVISTRDRLKEAARAKNVKLEINRTNSGQKPTFSGDPGNTTIVEFLSQVDSYIDRCGIPYEESGLLIKNQCKDRAREVVNDEFGIEENPNPEEIKACLRTHFGLPPVVMAQITNTHRSIGVIPEPVQYGENKKKNLQSAKDILDKTRKHLEMIKKSAPFRPKPPAEDPSDEFAVHDEYIQVLVEMLPSLERNEYYKNHRNHHGEAKLQYVINLMEGIKNTVQYIVIRGNLTTEASDISSRNQDNTVRGGSRPKAGRGRQRAGTGMTFNTQPQDHPLDDEKGATDVEAKMGEPPQLEPSHAPNRPEYRQMQTHAANPPYVQGSGQQYGHTQNNARPISGQRQDSPPQRPFGWQRNPPFQPRTGNPGQYVRGQPFQPRGGQAPAFRPGQGQQRAYPGGPGPGGSSFTCPIPAEIGPDVCFICNHMKTEFGIEPPNKVHARTEDGKLVLESCPHILNLVVPDKEHFLGRSAICRVCLKSAVSSHHSEESCTLPVASQTRLKCNVCHLRAAVCGRHVESNQQRLIQKQNLFDRIGIPSRFLALDEGMPSFLALNESEDEDDTPNSFVAHTESGRTGRYSSEEELLEAHRQNIGGAIRDEPAGQAVFIFCRMLCDNGQSVLVTFDNCSTNTVIEADAVDNPISGVEVELEGRSLIRGIGGIQRTNNACILVPLTDGSYYKIYAQTVRKLFTNKHSELQEEARSLRKQCIEDGVVVDGELDYARSKERCVLLIGMRNLDIHPIKVHTTAAGLSLYTCNIRSEVTNAQGLTYCFGGPIGLLQHYQETHGESFMAPTENLTDGEIVERIPEIKMTQEEVGQHADQVATLSESSSTTNSEEEVSEYCTEPEPPTKKDRTKNTSASPPDLGDEDESEEDSDDEPDDETLDWLRDHDGLEEALTMMAHTHIGDAKYQPVSWDLEDEGIKIRSRFAAATHRVMTASKKLDQCRQCSNSVSLSYIGVTGKIPIDERRTEYINRTLATNVKLTSADIEEMLTGPSAETTWKNLYCKNCRHCQNALKSESLMVEIDKEEALFEDTIEIRPNGDIVCKLPMPPDGLEKLSANRVGAKRRLQRELTKLAPLEESKKQVREAWEKMRENGFIKKKEELPLEEVLLFEEGEPKHYFSTSIAYKVGSLSSAARLCMDCSSPSSAMGAALNSILPKGDVPINLPRNFQGFVTFPSMSVADISSYYNRFKLHPSQYHLQNFLWSESLDPREEPTDYICVTLFFGVISVSKICLRAMTLLASMYPSIARPITRFSYVDDVQNGNFTAEETARVKSELIEKLGHHSLVFKGWAENGKLPDNTVSEEGAVTYLGVQWFSMEDVFLIKIPKLFIGSKKKGNIEKLRFFEGNTAAELYDFIGGKLTLRTLLARVMGIFDSSGILSPLLGALRNIIREANRFAPGDYDTDLPGELVESFCQQITDIHAVRHFVYQRTQHPMNLPKKELQIIGISDAGAIGKQSVCYTRAQLEPGKWSVSYLTARNYLVKPVQTIARSELDALHLLCREMDSSEENLEPFVVKKIAFTDSLIVAHWILNTRHSLQLFHRVRCAQIRQSLTDSDGRLNLYYIKSSENIADIGTKGKCTAEDISPNSTFFRGPAFLREDLQKAEDLGIIMHVSKLKKQLTREEQAMVNDGIITKHGGICREMIPSDLKEDFNIAQEDDNITFLAASMTATKTLYDLGGYITNPLKLPFRKGHLVHLVAFKCVLKLLRLCVMKSGSKTFGKILTKWESRTGSQKVFSFLAHSDFSSYDQQLRGESKLRALNHARKIENNEKTSHDHHDSGLSQLISSYEDRIFASKTESELRSVASEIDKAAHQFTEKKESQDERLKRISHTLCLMALGKMKPTEKTDLRTRIKPFLEYKYSGTIRLVNKMDKANKMIDRWQPTDIKIAELIEVGAILLSSLKFAEAYLKHEHTKLMARIVQDEVFKTIRALDPTILKKLEQAIKEFASDPLTFMSMDSPDSILELYEWMSCGSVSIPTAHPDPGSRLPKDLKMTPRHILPEFITNQAEFAELQQTVFHYFHRVLTREIKATWSREKINAHCFEKDGLLFSTWRLRAGAELVDNMSKELNHMGCTNRIIRGNNIPSWPSLAPVGDKNSPLVLALALHFHYNENLNPLGRPRLASHRGVHLNHAQLLQVVVSPGVTQVLAKIRDGCSLCHLRLNRHFQAMMAPLPPTSQITNPGFLMTMLDQIGPYKVRLLRNTRELRGSIHPKMYICAFVCMTSRAIHLELVEDMGAVSLARAITRLAHSEQMPAIIYCDRHKSNIHVMENSELLLQTNDILMKTKKIKCHFAPVSDHHSHGMFKQLRSYNSMINFLGLVESKIRGVQRMLGCLDLELHPLSQLEFQDALLHIAEQMNTVPLGVSLDSHDPALMLVTPNKLLGKFNERRPIKPITVPADMKGILRQNKERFDTMTQLFSTVIFPHLVRNTKWYKDTGKEVCDGAVILFKKKEGSNFVKKWSIGKVLCAYKGPDGRARSALVEYRGSPDNREETEKDEKKAEISLDVTKLPRRTTHRDVKDLIPLFPVCLDINADLKHLHYEILRCEDENYKLRMLGNQPSPTPLEEEQITMLIAAGECEHGVSSGERCSICNIMSHISHGGHFKIWLTLNGSNTLFETEYQGDTNCSSLSTLSRMAPGTDVRESTKISRQCLENTTYAVINALGRNCNITKPFSYPSTAPDDFNLTDLRIHHEHEGRELSFPFPLLAIGQACKPSKDINKSPTTIKLSQKDESKLIVPRVQSIIASRAAEERSEISWFGWKHVPWQQCSSVITRAIDMEDTCPDQCYCPEHCEAIYRTEETMEQVNRAVKV